MTRIEELQAMVAELEGEALFIDQDGDACLAPPGRELNLVALPGRDDDGSLLRPDAWAAMVNRFNEFPTLATEHAAALAREAELREALEAKFSFERADWYWRVMDPDDCGQSPEEAINRAMVGRFCVCEIASSFSGPTRYGFIAPVTDPNSDDEEFVHFATQQEAIQEAKTRAALGDKP